MKITFLGHAGFLVDCGEDVVLCDPWFDPAGAYAAAWFPFPANDHLDLDALERATHLYISHWHRDHYDEWFLKGRSKSFKERVQVVIAKFKYSKLREWIEACGYRNIRELDVNEEFVSVNGTRLFIQRDENPLYVDSAITIGSKGETFVNENDCKLSIAQEEEITRRFGKIDVLTAQFSGATFHPTCYDYTAEQLRKICSVRRVAKFRRVLDSIRRLGAGVYLPSAGPACFLSPDLQHLNLSDQTVFATAREFEAWLSEQDNSINYEELAPGGIIHAHSREGERSASAQLTYDTPEYIERYARQRKKAIEATLAAFPKPSSILAVTSRAHFQYLLDLAPELAQTADVALEVVIPTVATFVADFRKREIAEALPNTDQQIYRLEIEPVWMQALVDSAISWEAFILSFRFKISRTPDVYNEALIAFLELQTEEQRRDYVEYREKMRHQRTERVQRMYDGNLIEHDRYCPHNGEDLSKAPIENGVLTCPRHFWRFSMAEGGCGLNNPCSIDVVRV